MFEETKYIETFFELLFILEKRIEADSPELTEDNFKSFKKMVYKTDYS